MSRLLCFQRHQPHTHTYTHPHPRQSSIWCVHKPPANCIGITHGISIPGTTSNKTNCGVRLFKENTLTQCLLLPLLALIYPSARFPRRNPQKKNRLTQKPRGQRRQQSRTQAQVTGNGHSKLLSSPTRGEQTSLSLPCTSPLLSHSLLLEPDPAIATHCRGLEVNQNLWVLGKH